MGTSNKMIERFDLPNGEAVELVEDFVGTECWVVLIYGPTYPGGIRMVTTMHEKKARQVYRETVAGIAARIIAE